MVIGIDVSKLTLDAAALRDTGEVLRAGFENTRQGHLRLIAWLLEFSDVKLALEATSSYHQQLVRALQQN